MRYVREICKTGKCKESYSHTNYNKRSINNNWNVWIQRWQHEHLMGESGSQYLEALKVFKVFLWNAGFKSGWSRTDVCYSIFVLEPMSDNWYLGHLLASFYYLFFSLGFVCWHILKFWLIVRHYIWRIIAAWVMISLSKVFSPLVFAR